MITASFRGEIGTFSLDAHFTAPSQGITALFGRSGCGKTSILRCIAGLQRVADGICSIGDDIWQNATSFRPAHQRPIGMVFQEASLFAHLNVRRNLRYGEPKSPPPGGLSFDEIVDLLSLGPLLERNPHHLSGGERQRVAIGRALLSQPRLLLLDEPLTGLDQAAKDEVMRTLERLHAAIALPIILVSHDITEVERLADYLVLIESGHVRASGPLTELQRDPTLPLALSRDAAVSLNGRVAQYDPTYGLSLVDVPGARLLVPTAPIPLGTNLRLRIAARDVSLAVPPAHASTISNVLPAIILQSHDAGPHERIVLLGLGEYGSGAQMLARVTQRSWDQLSLLNGMPVLAQIKGVALLAGTTADQTSEASAPPPGSPSHSPDNSE